MMSSDLPRQAALDFRNELLRNRWPDDLVVGKAMGFPEADVARYLASARAEGLLVGVWSEPRRRFVYPDFQFDRAGRVRPEVSELLTVLPNEADIGGWRRAFWLYSPHALLGGLLPATVFVDDPQRVIEVAKQEFAGARGSEW